MAGDHTVRARLGQSLAEIQVEALAAEREAPRSTPERMRTSFREIASLARQCRSDLARVLGETAA